MRFSFSPCFKGSTAPWLQVGRRLSSGQDNFFMSQKLTSLLKNFDHSANIIWAKSIRQAVPTSSRRWVLIHNKIPRVSQHSDPQMRSPQQEDFHTKTLKTLLPIKLIIYLNIKFQGREWCSSCGIQKRGHTLIPCQLNKGLAVHATQQTNKKREHNVFPKEEFWATGRNGSISGL